MLFTLMLDPSVHVSACLSFWWYVSNLESHTMVKT